MEMEIICGNLVILLPIKSKMQLCPTSTEEMSGIVHACLSKVDKKRQTI